MWGMYGEEDYSDMTKGRESHKCSTKSLEEGIKEDEEKQKRIEESKPRNGLETLVEDLGGDVLKFRKERAERKTTLKSTLKRGTKTSRKKTGKEM